MSVRPAIGVLKLIAIGILSLTASAAWSLEQSGLPPERTGFNEVQSLGLTVDNANKPFRIIRNSYFKTAQVEVPVVTPFVWSAEKSDSGSVVLSGYAPDAAGQRRLSAAAGPLALDSTSVARGAPADFVVSAELGLTLLARLDAGDLAFDGSHWRLTGQAGKANDQKPVLDEVEQSRLEKNGWIIAIEGPALPESGGDVDAPQTAAAEISAIDDPAPVSAAVVLAPPPYFWSAEKSEGGAIKLSGSVPNGDLADYLVGLAGEGATSQMQIVPGAPTSFVNNVSSALSALDRLDLGGATFSGSGWSLIGEAKDEETRAAITASIGLVRDKAIWQVAVSGPSPLRVCQHKLAEFGETEVILFSPASSRVAVESLAALDELAVDLKFCPNAVIRVEGHTDADGSADENLALSVARAEAVTEALASRGIDQDRLYAIGFGESVPIASNETATGKRLNRRIVIEAVGQADKEASQ